MTFSAKLADYLLSIPAQNDLTFRIARRIVARHDGEGDSRMERNGELRALAQHPPGRGAVFDVGANIGEWARAVQSIAPEADIHCFEPANSSFAMLSANVRGATLNNVGVGAKAEYLDLYVYKDGAELNSLHAFEGSGQTPLRSERVQMITLDDYARSMERIAFLKVDTEGHELAVLVGAADLLSDRRIDVVQFEYSGWYIESRTLLRDVWDKLAGYNMFKILPHRLLPLERYSHQLENYRLANFLAVRKT